MTTSQEMVNISQEKIEELLEERKILLEKIKLLESEKRKLKPKNTSKPIVTDAPGVDMKAIIEESNKAMLRNLERLKKEYGDA